MDLKTITFNEIVSFVKPENVKRFCAIKNLGTYYIEAENGEVLLSENKIEFLGEDYKKSYGSPIVKKLYENFRSKMLRREAN